VNQYAQLVRQRFPEDELKIEVTNYPVESARALLAQALSLAKFAFLGIVIANIQVHTMLGVEQPPQFLVWAWENKGYACMMAFFIGNAIENGLTSTGAFEIYLSGDKMWSKLESGRIPSQGEFMKMINDNMALEAGTFDNQF
jgi:selT/selW/selH-like putative selenoprotein